MQYLKVVWIFLKLVLEFSKFFSLEGVIFMCAFELCQQTPHIYNMGVPVTYLPTDSEEKGARNPMVSRVSSGETLTRTLVDRLVLTLTPTNEKPYNFIEKIKLYLSNYLDVNWDEYIPVSSGYGYNTGLAFKTNTGATLVIKYFDPDMSTREDFEYSEGSKLAYFRRQGVQVQLTGDVLQELRAKGLIYPFILDLRATFKTKATQIDCTLDVFNAPNNLDLTPVHFFDLYRQDKYTGQAKVGVVGDAKLPTVYIGKMRSARSIMMYDKKQEGLDTLKVDEPELFEACKSWFRLEVRYARDFDDADTVLEYILSKDEDSMPSLIGQVIAKTITSKCRFLKLDRNSEKNVSRIPTDEAWDYLLKLSSEATMDFASHRLELTLDERKMNFIKRGVGGAKLLQDIVNEEGREALEDFVERCLG